MYVYMSSGSGATTGTSLERGPIHACPLYSHQTTTAVANTSPGPRNAAVLVIVFHDRQSFALKGWPNLMDNANSNRCYSDDPGVKCQSTCMYNRIVTRECAHIFEL
jgi:hypothetical protein